VVHTAVPIMHLIIWTAATYISVLLQILVSFSDHSDQGMKLDTYIQLV